MNYQCFASRLEVCSYDFHGGPYISTKCTLLQDFYEAIDRAELLDFLKNFLIHEDANVRAKACSAIGNMCRHSSYFYNLLVSGFSGTCCIEF